MLDTTSHGTALARVAGALKTLYPEVDPAGHDVDAVSVAEAMWLAALLPPIKAELPEPSVGPSWPSDPAGPTAPGTAVRTKRTNGLRQAYHAARRGNGPGTPGSAVMVPHSEALPMSLDLARSLRPLKRVRAAGRVNRLDLPATIAGYIRSLELFPIFGPARERWFEVVVVVDSSATMVVWRDTMTELRRALYRTGAFRTLHSLQLAVAGNDVILRGPTGQPVNPRQVNSPDGRRVVLVVSDCSAQWWRDGLAWNQLGEWAKTSPTALINPLPPKLWRYVGLDLPAVRAGSPSADGRPNTALSYSLPLILTTTKACEWTVLPVMALTPHSVGKWAHTLMRIDNRGCDALLVPSARLRATLDELGNDGEIDVAATKHTNGSLTGEDSLAERIVAGFLHHASPAAVRLAALCTLPNTETLDLGIVHGIREQLLPEATVSDMAEVVTSGLFTVIADDDQKHAILGFKDGVPDRLKSLLGAQDYWQFREAFSRHIAAQAGLPGGFPVVVRDPRGSHVVPSDAAAVADLAEPTMERLGAPDREKPPPERQPDVRFSGKGREAVSAALADELSRLRPEGTFTIADFRARDVVLWEVYRDGNGTPQAMQRSLAFPASTDAELFHAQLSAVTSVDSSLLVVKSTPGEYHDSMLAVLSAARPDAAAYSCQAPVEVLLRDVIANSPLTRWYEFVVLRRTFSGRLVFDCRPLFPPGAQRGFRTDLRILCEPSDAHGTVLAVVTRAGHRRFRLLSVQMVNVAPGSYDLTAQLRRPGRVSFAGLPAQPQAERRRWSEIIDAVPARLDRPAAVHLVCVLEVSGTRDQLRRRIDRIEQLIRRAEENNGPIAVSLVSYGPHAFDRNMHEEPATVLAWAASSVQALTVLRGLITREPPADDDNTPPREEYPRAAQLECALAKVAGTLTTREGRPVLVAVGSRPPHPPRADVRTEILPCPRRRDWSLILRQLLAVPGISCGSLCDRDADGEVWEKLGVNAFERLGVVDVRRFAAQLGLSERPVQYVPFPFDDRDETPGPGEFQGFDPAEFLLAFDER